MFKDGIDTTGEEIYSFLMIGQSNMAGRGELLKEAQIDNPNCYMFRMGRWQKMSEPINPDRPLFGIKFPSGACLATSFADSIANDLGVKVGLIPCADGGTGIDAWEKGSVLYDYTVMMTRLAMRSSKVIGIIWHQGETDCYGNERAVAHKQKFIDMTGQKIGKLTVVERVQNDCCGRAQWLCKCECGEEIVVQGNALRNNRITSCWICRKESE